VKQTILACALTLVALTANAQEIVLSSSDGKFSLRGKLVEYVDQKYTIDTSVGTLTIDGAAVTCAGEACPVIEIPVSEFSIVGAGPQTSDLIEELLPLFAQSLGGQASPSDAPGSVMYTLTNAEAKEVAKITLPNSSSSQNQISLLQGRAAIALSSSPIREQANAESDVDKSLTPGSSQNKQVIGLDAIAIVTAEQNPINSISMRDAALVFSGSYSNWSELGGVDAPIKLYGPQSDSDLAVAFTASVIDSQGNDLTGLTENIVAANDIASSVASDPNGIGYTRFANANPAKTLAIREVCGLETPINQFTIKAEQYPLTQRLYANSTIQPAIEHVDRLLDFMQSDSGQAIVSSYGLINQRETSSSISTQGIRLANAINSSATVASDALLKKMVAQIIDSDRLSTTFRFVTGSNQMDQRAKADIKRLAEKLRAPEYASATLHLLGFTDSVGNFDLNQELSLRRANLVRDALIEYDATLEERVSVAAFGYGEMAPIACNETALGRTINRRVEVWLSKTDTLPPQ